MIASTDPSRMLYACDSFEGLPGNNKDIDLHQKGDFADTSFEAVRKHLDLPNVEVIKGFFLDPIIHKHMYDLKYSFVHIDVDLYQPTLDCLEFFYKRMVPVGVLVLDDYKHYSCPGVERAVVEFMVGKPEDVVDTTQLSCYVVKL